jgi:serine/threonine protein kinase
MIDLTPGNCFRTVVCPQSLYMPIPNEIFEKSESIASSQFTTIHRIYLPQCTFVVKRYSLSKAKTAVNEIQCFLRCLHENVVQFYGYWVDLGSVYIALESLPFDLFDIIYESVFPFDPKSLILPICNVLRFLHGKNIIYRDLKPENILIKNSKTVKLCDFGHTIITENGLPQCKNATIDYMSPEMIHNSADPTKLYSSKTDVWSFGVLLYEMYMSKPPFKNKHSILVDDVELPPEIPKKIREIIARCLSKDPENRPTFDDIIDYFSI